LSLAAISLMCCMLHDWAISRSLGNDIIFYEFVANIDK